MCARTESIGNRRWSQAFLTAKIRACQANPINPGSFIDDIPGIRTQPGPALLPNAMMKDYGHKVEGAKEFSQLMAKSIEGSLQRVNTDHFRVVMAPHEA